MIVDLVALIVCVAALVGLVCWLAWDTRIRYGPVIAGNARWRREAPVRATCVAQREALAALTADDRAWLTAQGWTDPYPEFPAAAIRSWIQQQQVRL